MAGRHAGAANLQPELVTRSRKGNPRRRVPRAPRKRNPQRRIRQRLRRLRRSRRIKRAVPCTPRAPDSRDNLTGWFVYKCGKGILLVPAPRCMPSDCHSPGPRRTRDLGIGDQVAAGEDGTMVGARRAMGLTSLTGTEIATALAPLDDLRQSGAISDSYYRRARAAIESDADAFFKPYAPGVLQPVLGRPVASGALRDLALGVLPTPIGPSVREGCACTPRDFDAVDPVSGWGIYYVPGGVLLTPTKKCIAGGGRPLGFIEQTWRNIVALFKTPPTIAPEAAPLLPPITPSPGAPTPPPPPPTTPCEPDNVVGRDDGMFGTGWWIVKGPPGRTGLVPNPRTCP